MIQYSVLPRGGNAALLSKLLDQQRFAAITGMPVDPALLEQIEATYTPPPRPLPKQAPPATGIYGANA